MLFAISILTMGHLILTWGRMLSRWCGAGTAPTCLGRSAQSAACCPVSLTIFVAGANERTVLTMTPDDLDQAIAWFGNRRPQMPGARKMYGLAYAALKAIKVDQEQLEGLSRDDLIAVCIISGRQTSTGDG